MKKRRIDFYSENVAGIVFSSPFIIGFILFMVVPVGISCYYSLCDFNILSEPVFRGINNYKMILEDETFWKSLKVTIFYTVVSVPLKLIFALIVAQLLLKTSKITGLYRALYYLPSIIGGSVAVAILWKRMFATDGLVNNLLGRIGIEPTAWLGDTKVAIWILILLTVWQFGSSMLIFLSALKQIPTSLYEASTVDGAGKWKQFIKVTLPLLTPTIFFNLVMQMINGLLAFTQCFIITKGQPMDSTLFYMVYMYRQSFEFYNTGYGAALAWVMLVIVGIVTAILFATKKLWVYEGGY